MSNFTQTKVHVSHGLLLVSILLFVPQQQIMNSPSSKDMKLSLELIAICVVCSLAALCPTSVLFMANSCDVISAAYSFRSSSWTMPAGIIICALINKLTHLG